MKLTRRDFERFKPLANYVLVKPAMGNSKLELPSGVVLFLDTSYDENKHAETRGTVVRTPMKLTFDKKDPHHTMDWKTEIELQEGDDIIYHYLSAANAVGDGEYIDCEGEIYFLIRYDQIFVAKRGEDVIPVNGFILVEPMAEDVKLNHGLILPDYLKERKDSKKGIVKYIGSCNQAYLPDAWANVVDQDNIRPGDLVVYDPHCDIPLQYDLHANFEGKKTFWRIQRRYISAIIQQGAFENSVEHKVAQD
jgi:co-chaperonin GroES (HSP10)